MKTLHTKTYLIISLSKNERDELLQLATEVLTNTINKESYGKERDGISLRGFRRRIANKIQKACLSEIK